VVFRAFSVPSAALEHHRILQCVVRLSLLRMKIEAILEASNQFDAK
jgi:hypothetical protein